jgi:hypothetical protein
MIKNTGPLIQRPNAEILDGLRGSMSAAYRSRIPKSDQGDASATIRALQKYQPHMNEFINALVNRIGLEIFRRNSWTNPLGVFKLGLMEFGDTVEEIQVGLLKAHHYNENRETSIDDIYGTEIPEVQTSFHRINRKVHYKVTITEVMLNRAFLTTNGLSSMIAQLMEAPTTSDQVDEFLAMTQLFREYDANGGFYRINIPDVAASTSTEADAKAALRSIRATAGNLKFINPKYNAANMETAVDTEKLVLFVSPEFRAGVDVNALAAMFNKEYGETISRIIDIPADRLAADDIQAILTTEDFFVVMDTVFKTAEIMDPTKLSWNHFLHHQSIISCSRFVPAIAFTTGPGTEDVEDDFAVTGVSDIKIADEAGTLTTIAADGTDEVIRGYSYQLEAHGTTATAGEETAVRWSVEGESTFQTFISPDGVLHVSGIEEGVMTDLDGAGANPAVPVITVRATTVWVNPADPGAAPFTKTARLTVTGDTLEAWPVPEA